MAGPRQMEKLAFFAICSIHRIKTGITARGSQRTPNTPTKRILIGNQRPFSSSPLGRPTFRAPQPDTVTPLFSPLVPTIDRRVPQLPSVAPGGFLFVVPLVQRRRNSEFDFENTRTGDGVVRVCEHI